MIRIITYIVISIFAVTVSLGQVKKTEDILLKNKNIKLPITFTTIQKDSSSLEVAFPLSKKITIVNFVNQ